MALATTSSSLNNLLVSQTSVNTAHDTYNNLNVIPVRALQFNNLVSQTAAISDVLNAITPNVFKASVISGVGATATLTAAQSGSTVLFDAATGVKYTLPAATTANIGVTFLFVVTTAVTSNAHEVDAASSSDLIIGAVLMDKASATTPSSFTANGSSNYKIASNGTTTGGLAGTTYELTCVAANKWAISGGLLYGSGTLATPFAG